MMRFLLPAATVAAIALGLAAGPAAADSAKDEPAYTATMDCGRGPFEVVSSDELFAPLVHRRSGRRYHPVAWDVTVDGERIVKKKKGAKKRRRVMRCSYEDKAAVGTVTVKKP